MRLRTLGRFELVDDEPYAVRVVASQPKRLALLAYLALATPRGTHRRDTLLALFWPELDEEHGRLALRQALHALRRSLGDTQLQSLADDQIALTGECDWCDAVAFDHAIGDKRDSDALTLYEGPFFNGIFIADASPGLEQWIGLNRVRLGDSARAAAMRLGVAARDSRDLLGAVRWAERAWAIAPEDETGVRFLMDSLGRIGDRTRALRIYQLFAKRIGAELDAEPDDETEALATTLRFAPAVALIGDAPAGGNPPTIASTNPSLISSAPAESQPDTARLSQPAELETVPRQGSVPGRSAQTKQSLLVNGWVRTAALAVAIIAAAVLPRVSISALRSFTHIRDTNVDAKYPTDSPPTRAVVARRLYDEGVRAFSANAPVAAEQLFNAALATDSTLAMAAYYAARTEMLEDHPTNLEVANGFFRLASNQSSNVSDRERLLIAEAYADFGNDPARLAFAETLAVRYPRDPVGQFRVGYDRVWSGAFLSAIAPLRAAVVLDLGNPANRRADCVGCDALKTEIVAYRMADSTGAAERVAREWVQRAPSLPEGWRELAVVLAAEGRYAEAKAAYGESADRNRNGAGLTRDMADLAIRAGDFNGADRLLAGSLAGGADQRQQALWLYVVSLRCQGRMREALVAAHALRVGERRSGVGANVQMYSALPEAQVLLEMTRAHEAGVLFDSIGRTGVRALRPGLDARHRVWTATLTAEALAAQHDTMALARLIEPIRRAGAISAYGRDPLLMHHVRGLLFTLNGDLPGAAIEFRRALFSKSMGYTRTNYDLARVLTALDRPAEAIAVLQPAFRGALDGSNMYVTRTDLHEALAQAFDMAGMRDSAIVHYRAVISAWHSADANLRARRDSAAARVIILSVHRAL